MISNKEFSYGELIEKNKIGLGLNSYEIKHTKKILEELKIGELKSNVKKFYEKNMLG